jgi:hypothetical protein
MEGKASPMEGKASPMEGDASPMEGDASGSPRRRGSRNKGFLGESYITDLLSQQEIKGGQQAGYRSGHYGLGLFGANKPI